MLEVKKFTSGAVTLEYVQKGEQPRWLIHTGTHGDEAGVIESVRRFLESSWEKMPNFLWVMAASPAAVRLGTRANQDGHDLNRMFFKGAADPEAQANLALLRRHTFEVFISVHEDTDRHHECYLYDSDDKRDSLQRFWARLASQGISAFTGIDDPRDPALGNQIQDGYHSLVEEQKAGRASGDEESFATEYLQRIGRVTGRRLNPEIPGQADQPTKDFIVSTFFEYLLDWWGRQPK
jgi:hypothetical protein